MADPTAKKESPARVALVGHCGPDCWTLKSAVNWALPGAQILTIGDESTLTSSLGTIDLALINRVLDGRFKGESGIALIRRLRADGAAAGIALMLVSNFEEAQRDAEAAGAVPGFGKSDANTEKAKRRMREAVAART